MATLRLSEIVLLEPSRLDALPWQVPCHVVAVTGNEVALEPCDPEHLERIQVAESQLFLTYTRGRRLHALRGNLMIRSSLRANASTSEAPDIRFRVTDRISHWEESRLPFCAPVTLTPVDAGGGDEPLQTQTRSITVSDLVVEQPLPRGATYAVSLALPGAPSDITGRATVTTEHPEGATLKYRWITPDSRDRLVGFIVECHREALRLYQLEQSMRAAA